LKCNAKCSCEVVRGAREWGTGLVIEGGDIQILLTFWVGKLVASAAVKLWFGG
jgi:hypothetical protein